MAGALGMYSVAVATGATGSPGVGYPTATVSLVSFAPAEGDSGVAVYTFAITRTDNLDTVATQNWYVYGVGTAPASGSDFAGGTYPSGTVTFAVDETTQYVTIEVAGDTVAEPDETFMLSLTNVGIFNNVSPDFSNLPGYIAVASIINDDAPAPTTYNLMAGYSLTESITGPQSVTQAEGNGGVNSVSYMVWRHGDISQGGSVDWALTGTGIRPLGADDFPEGVMPSGTTQFAPGQAYATISIAYSADHVPEPDETGIITLSNPTCGGVENGTATLTITNDDSITHSGTAGNDKITVLGTYPSSLVDLRQGGDDKVTGGGNNDVFLLGAALTAKDTINGMGGHDTLVLDGNYSAGIKLGSATVNASAEENGNITFVGGAGSDIFTGGSGVDIFIGGSGADILAGGKGTDMFAYNKASDSPFQLSGSTIDASSADRINNFQVGVDTIDLTGLMIPAGARGVVTKSTGGFRSNLSDGTDYFGTAGIAVEYAGTGKSVAARIYVDANHDGDLGAGDIVLQVSGVGGDSITAASFQFRPCVLARDPPDSEHIGSGMLAWRHQCQAGCPELDRAQLSWQNANLNPAQCEAPFFPTRRHAPAIAISRHAHRQGCGLLLSGGNARRLAPHRRIAGRHDRRPTYQGRGPGRRL